MHYQVEIYPRFDIFAVNLHGFFLFSYEMTRKSWESLADITKEGFNLFLCLPSTRP